MNGRYICLFRPPTMILTVLPLALTVVPAPPAALAPEPAAAVLAQPARARTATQASEPVTRERDFMRVLLSEVEDRWAGAGAGAGAVTTRFAFTGRPGPRHRAAAGATAADVVRVR